MDRHRDLIAVSVVHTLNAALCEFHLKNCPPSEQLATECAKASALYKATQTALHALEQLLSQPQSPATPQPGADDAQVRWGHDACDSTPACMHVDLHALMRSCRPTCMLKRACITTLPATQPAEQHDEAGEVAAPHVQHHAGEAAEEDTGHEDAAGHEHDQWQMDECEL